MADLDRRSFLKAALGAGAATSLFALAGCTSGSGSGSASGSASAAASGSASAAASGSASAAAATKKISLPSDIANLDVIKATPWIKISDNAADFLEGPCFDKDGNMFICHRYPVEGGMAGEILKIDKDGKFEKFFEGGLMKLLNGLAFHEDGRLFVADVAGGILILDKDGKQVGSLVAEYNGHKLQVNDLIFGKNGDLYVTDFSGNALNLAGGIYRYTAASNYTEIIPFQQNMNTPNGIAFTPDFSAIYTAESALNRILRIRLADDGGNKNSFLDPCVIYVGQGTGGPDSMRIDASGNIYQAFQPAGRALVFDASGIPIKNVLLEDRDKGDGLLTTTPALDPFSNQGYLVSLGAHGAWIYKFDALDKAAPSFYIPAEKKEA